MLSGGVRIETFVSDMSLIFERKIILLYYRKFRFVRRDVLCESMFEGEQANELNMHDQLILSTCFKGSKIKLLMAFRFGPKIKNLLLYYSLSLSLFSRSDFENQPMEKDGSYIVCLSYQRRC